jgi:hypothetical protein
MMKMKHLLYLLLGSIVPMLAISQENIEQAVAAIENENPYLSVENAPLIIAFSGTPGMGKTHLAKAVQERYEGVRVSTDTARKYLGKKLHGTFVPVVNKLLDGSPNQLLILDSSIDRKYSEVEEFAREHSIPLVTIRLLAERGLVEERIHESKENPAYYMKYLDLWYSDYEKFGEMGLWQLEFDSAQEEVSSLLDRLSAHIGR